MKNIIITTTTTTITTVTKTKTQKTMEAHEMWEMLATETSTTTQKREKCCKYQQHNLMHNTQRILTMLEIQHLYQREKGKYCGGTEVIMRMFYLSRAHNILSRVHNILSRVHKILKWCARDT